MWSLVDFLDDCRPIGCIWVFKTKCDSKGHVERYKAKLVVKDYSQREGKSLCIIMTIVAHFDLELHQMDVRTTFLN